ncbi:DNA-binding response regulator [Alsobacter metallidurans]|uniref:DNA-binding response regulator n=1 Tax=Alsobacter metallidurans TaxID=340221 RepID=A0A917I640_9HYPH|nr:response regulator transcription factor [Alsobacter metallidurans]GGH13155.1 DNA-binding response regulator [Alsobacter metallidurans]
MPTHPVRRVLLVAAKTIWRDLLAAHLAREAPDLTITCTERPTAPENGSSLPELMVFILNEGELPGFLRDLDSVRALYPGTSVAVISDCDDPRVVSEAVRAGVEGYLPMSMASDALAHALRILLAGGEFVPSAVLVRLAAERANRSPRQLDQSRPAAPQATFSRRESDVLALLRHGKANKAIASELKLREGTVKVHVRSLMRKLNARNRTEVAVYASQPQAAEASNAESRADR